MRMALALGLAATLAGCGGGDKAANQTAPASNIAAPTNATLAAPAPAAQPVKLAEKTETLDFSYSWPAQAAAIPGLDQWLRGNAASLKAEAAKTAKDDKAGSVSEAYAFNQHSYSEDWKVVADGPRLLVMQSEGYQYTGGAHGFPVATVILWDRQAAKRLALSAVLDADAMEKATRKAFCAELDRQRAERRGGPVEPDEAVPTFSACVPAKPYGFIPIATKGSGVINQIRVSIPPYEAGPYAEGTYEIDLPMTQAMLAAVKPDYRAAFGTP